MSKEAIEFEIWELERAQKIAQSYASQCSTPEIIELHKSFITSCQNLINELKLQLEEQ